jgi:hypothetical protein
VKEVKLYSIPCITPNLHSETKLHAPLCQSAIDPFITSKENTVPERYLNLAHMSKYYGRISTQNTNQAPCILQGLYMPCPTIYRQGEYFVLMVLSLQWRNDDPQKWIANTQIRIRKGR